MSLRGVLLTGLMLTVDSKRLNVRNARGEVHNSVEDVLDFDFMTKEKVFAGHQVSDWWGNRSFVDGVKDEIVKGHTCQKHAGQDQTYYASSFCYWLPDFSNGYKLTDPGMHWTNGRYPSEKNFGRALNTPGKCLKLATCHNNARALGGHVQSHVFAEELTLPAWCFKEKQIEHYCLEKYHDTVPDLKVTSETCSELRDRYEKTQEDYKHAIGFLHSLPTEVVSYPAMIKTAQDELLAWKAKSDSAEALETERRKTVIHRCKPWGSESFVGWGSSDSQTDGLLSHVFTHCPQYLKRTGADAMETHSHCLACEQAKSDLKAGRTETSTASREFRAKEQQVFRLTEMAKSKEKQWSEWQEQNPGLIEAKDEVAAVWEPQKERCETAIHDFTQGVVSAVSACAPTFYKFSCERACIELQNEQGCGVVEGSHPGDAAGMGGVTVQCVPPQPSWILAPFTYGKHEERDQQCKRIEEHQKVRYAQKVLKSGWLWKKGQVNGWDKRFFVLESGDAVRSAVLRYWKEDPRTSIVAKVAAGKSVVVRDAESVSKAAGTEWGFENTVQCFTLFHFYRTYYFCTIADEAGNNPATAIQERDQWVALIKANIHDVNSEAK